MKASTLIRIAVSSIGVTTLGVLAAAAAPTDEERCKAGKIEEMGEYYACRMDEAAKAVEGRVADFSKCDSKLRDNLTKIDEKYGDPLGPGCTGAGPVLIEQVERLARRDSDDMACRFSEEIPVHRLERPSSIVTVGVVVPLFGSGPTLALQNYLNLFEHARCFYLSDSCVAGPEFSLDIPAQGVVKWPARTGSGDALGTPSIPFLGELICVEVDAADAPLALNGLVASVKDELTCAQDGDGLRGNPDLTFDGHLCIGGGAVASPGCPDGAEYEPCAALRGREEFTPSLLLTCADVVSGSFTFDCR